MDFFTFELRTKLICEEKGRINSKGIDRRTFYEREFVVRGAQRRLQQIHMSLVTFTYSSAHPTCDMCHKPKSLSRFYIGQLVHICEKCLWFYAYTWTHNLLPRRSDLLTYSYARRYSSVVPHRVEVREEPARQDSPCGYTNYILTIPDTYFTRLPHPICKTIARYCAQCRDPAQLFQQFHLAETRGHVIDCTNGKRQCVRGTVRVTTWRMCRRCIGLAKRLEAQL